MTSESERAGLLEEFKVMTGTTDEFAISFLDSSNWKLDQAMELFLGGSGGVAQQRHPRSAESSSSLEDEDETHIQNIMNQHGVDRQTAEAIKEAGGGATAGAGATDVDGVRAPILQKRARLFDTVEQEEEPGLGFLANDLSSLSVANAFEAQIHLAARHTMMANAANSAAEFQRPSLFAPPRWMMFVGSFEEARAEAKAKKRWLLINIQDQQEFQSLVLNRDLWSDETTQMFIRESFVFWQQEKTSPEAQRFITLYNPSAPFPNVCIIDPRTGERLRILKLKKKESDLRESFFEQITEFVDGNSFDLPSKARQIASAASSSGSAGSFKSAAPPATTTASTTRTDEDEELAAAIAASLTAEHHSKKPTEPNTKAPPPHMMTTSSTSSSSSARPITKAPPPVAAAAPTFVPLTPEPDASNNSTTIQFKFPDGSRTKRRFLKSDIVSMLFSFVAGTQKFATGSRFDLLTSGVPPRPLLADVEKTLIDADALNQTVIVRILE